MIGLQRSRPRPTPKSRDPHDPALIRLQDDLHAIHPGLTLRLSDRARRLALRMDTRGKTINLVIPPRASLKKALEFAVSYQDWIVRQMDKVPERILFVNGATIPVLGQDRVIRVISDDRLKRTSITLNDNEILIHTNKDDPAGRITRYLKNLAREEITRLTFDKTAQVNRKAAAIHIRDTSSRWGSCSPDGNLSFSWRLVLAPYHALDYVVAHEVAHLVHLNHGARFWTLCEKLSADYNGGHNWMKKHGQTLMRYG